MGRGSACGALASFSTSCNRSSCRRCTLISLNKTLEPAWVGHHTLEVISARGLGWYGVPSGTYYLPTTSTDTGGERFVHLAPHEAVARIVVTS